MSEENYCTDCRRETVVVFDRASGDAVCSECGLVLESRFIDETAEWRTFADDSGDHDPNRVGAAVNPLLSDCAPSTVVSGPVAGVSRVMNNQRDPSAAVVSAFSSIADLADRLSLVTTIKDRACEMYKRLHDQKANKGRKVEILAAACIFIACRQEGKSRTIKEICFALNGAKKKDFSRAVDFVTRTLKVEMIKSIDVASPNAGDYLIRFCYKLGMGYNEIKIVQETMQKLQELDIRRNPTSIAAAVIFMINKLSGSKSSLRDIANATTVAETTIRSACKDLYPYAQQILPECYVKGRDLSILS
ncbi:Transcription initiation factor TFIIB [Handroanthus impetiginosus]|uniref:Transcription initiation factor TFIIB n=1 Tax=Handroanthus impetiginosus TaxID=429701 RepID=A0A2G9HEW2_9LAMI|nr:Transcription initiation factor TFIIB [Handroanthus impetiginosus]